MVDNLEKIDILLFDFLFLSTDAVDFLIKSLRLERTSSISGTSL
ncbi:hypothetical protein EV03_0573 [Prochlorococcus marinus str. PAC1]|uniref:Uncharacterized protein n=1 Tax=Prochlorococcus marinus str. PAC1 TaxID=59924 RepID=A0A0A2C9T5_PROMR|nr:hypothetical protein EV03_0573 [Prochlorococcus marinus str. PAC1]